MKHTKGEWKYEKNSHYIEVNADNEDRILGVNVMLFRNGIPLTDMHLSEENEANAKLIAEAGTVTNECGLTPRQLLEQRNELLKALEGLNREIDKYWNGNKSDVQVSKITDWQRESLQAIKNQHSKR